MPRHDSKQELIERYLETKRRIHGIEQNALAKVGSPTSETPTCSFCAASAKDVPLLIKNEGNVRICSECVLQISRILRDEDGP